MYPDPKRVRDRRLTLRLDEYEHAVVVALANYQGEQPAALLRTLVMREAATLLVSRDDSILDRASA
ncbi:hypothetical protein [Trinickia mobilis]|uniref:hypothetical protein n=1 Tax=Trinickia mobilis TaxID=2816356 RepID=UPI001A8DACCA|nr:hypothetical protein [Trinickia mobilis]